MLTRVFLAGMTENFADLRLAAAAIDPRHQLGEPVAVGDPAGGAAFVQAPEINELNVEPAGARRLAKHVGLQACRPYPRSAAGSWWHRAQRSAARATPRSKARARAPARGTPRSPAWTRPVPAFAAAVLCSWRKFYTEMRQRRPHGISQMDVFATGCKLTTR